MVIFMRCNRGVSFFYDDAILIIFGHSLPSPLVRLFFKSIEAEIFLDVFPDFEDQWFAMVVFFNHILFINPTALYPIPKKNLFPFKPVLNMEQGSHSRYKYDFHVVVY